MEREASCGDETYLTSPVVAEILGVSKDFLTEIIEHKLVIPFRVPVRSNLVIWGPEDIFRAYLSTLLVGEFEKKYGGNHTDYKYEQIRRDLLSVKRLRGNEILESGEWAVIAGKALKKGLDLLDL
jgi:hypothetical protein